MSGIPVCRLPRIASFRPGTWNGRKFDPAFVQRLYDNFVKFSTGPRPWYRPFISLNHNDDLRFGHLSGAKLDRSGWLWLDAEEVPVAVGQARNSGMLTEPSIEFIEPKRDASGNIVSGFVGPDGRIVDGPVLKCLTFLGGDIPAVKGMPPLPTAVFSCRFGGITSRFGALPMDRASAIQFLQSLGVDTSQLTDAVPDAFLMAVVQMIQTLQQGAPPAAGTDPNAPPPVPQMSDLTGGIQLPSLPTVGSGTPTPAGTPGGQPNPSQIVLKFNQDLQAIIGSLNSQLGAVRVQTEAIRRQNDAALNAGKEGLIATFFDRMSKAGKVTVAMQPSLKLSLMKCDHLKTRKFSDAALKTPDGRTAGTELEEMFATIEATYPVQREFGPRVPPGGPLPQPGQAAGKLSAERRAAILGGSPVGAAILKAEAARK